MAQPTSCDGPSGSSEVESLILEERTNGEEGCQGRKEEGRKEAVILRKPFKGCSMEHPIFFIAHKLLRLRNRIGRDALPTGGSPRSEVVETGPTCQAAECAGYCDVTLAIRPPGEGGDHDGEESSQGRQEEGREEAITPLAYPPEGGRPVPFDWFPFTQFSARRTRRRRASPRIERPFHSLMTS
jgi:hypothetical protein